MSEQKTPTNLKRMPAPEAGSADTTLEPPRSIAHLQGFQRDLQRRAGRVISGRPETVRHVPSMGAAHETFAARIANLHRSQSADGTDSSYGAVQEERGMNMLLHHPLSTPDTTAHAWGTMPEGPVRPSLILSQPPVPVVSWLGIAPPAPERVEREPLAQERTTMMPTLIVPMNTNTPLSTVGVQTQSTDLMAKQAVLWRRQRPPTIASAAGRVTMPPVTPFSAIGAPIFAQLPIQSARLPMESARLPIESARLPMGIETASRSAWTPQITPDDDSRGRRGESPMDLKLPSLGLATSGMPMATSQPPEHTQDGRRHGLQTPAMVGRIPIMPRPIVPNRNTLPDIRSATTNGLAERAPERLYPATNGRQEHHEVVIQRSEAGSSPATSLAGNDAPPAGTGAEEATNPDAGANDIQLLANEVWYLLKRRIDTEAERSGY